MRRFSRIGAVGAFLAVVCTAAVALAAASRPPAYCNLPPGPKTPVWGFHTHGGAPITAATGSYAHGRGMLSGTHGTGLICQVDRSGSGPDRQIILTLTKGKISLQHALIMGGHIGNLLKLPVRVKSSTDPRCHVGTLRTLSLWATYDGIHIDWAHFSLGKSCQGHNHRYSGPSVAVLIPPHVPA